MTENHGDGYYRDLLDAIPLMIFVVDADVRIQDLNKAAAAVFGLDKGTILKRRGGEVLHCLHSRDVPEGCGRAPFCRDCVIRNSVTSTLKGQAITRRRTKVELFLGGRKTALELLITASPMPGNPEPLVLLIIEDINEISKLRDILPICSKCKKIRGDQDYWKSLESYFNEYIGVDFSHGICPACMKKLYPDLVEEKPDQLP
ncbi:MAG: PAS domain-containing protein [Syntrophobacterales bacterium]|jgi:PAS domain S-box-containing protein|nr:PAS domain-containing protein [Syntrophobacterales bacterium]